MRGWVWVCVALACNADEEGRTITVGTTLTTSTTLADTSGDTAGTTAPATESTGGDAEGTGGASTSDGTGTTTTVDTGGTDTGGFHCPPVGPLDCAPGPGSGEGDTCTKPGSCFLDTVQAAIQGVLDGHPEWFDTTSGQPFVLEVEAYMNQVVADVAATGLCAIRDPNAGDEIAVKHDQEYAENFDILTAEGFVRYGDGIYTSTCAPAWF